nr:hypothetical protein [Tanacetum cinerariifolium]
MREDEIARWERGNSTWGGRLGALGIVPVCVYAQEIAGGEGQVLAGKVVLGLLCELLGFKGLADLVLG